MYCGCNPIALSSQAQISEALVRLMGQKAYTSITVSELCRVSGISRQTFYSLFNSMENVVLFSLRERSCALTGNMAGSSIDQVCRCYSRYICDNRDFLKLLVRNHVEYLLYDSIYDTLLGCPDCARGVSDSLRQYRANFLAGGISGIVREYCMSEPPASGEALYAILCSLLEGYWQ